MTKDKLLKRSEKGPNCTAEKVQGPIWSPSQAHANAWVWKAHVGSEAQHHELCKSMALFQEKFLLSFSSFDYVWNESQACF